MKKNVFAITIIGMLLLSSFLTSPVLSSSNDSSSVTTNYEKEASSKPRSGNIVWDNGMDYVGLLAAQWDEFFEFPFYAYPADDFQFDEDTDVNDVKWIGGYYTLVGPSKDYNFSWNITFYEDRGDGNAPGDMIVEYVIDEADVIREVIYSDIDSWHANYSATLPENITFDENTKYWISIIGIGEVFPQSGWGYNHTSINLHQAVFKSNVLGNDTAGPFLDWNNTENLSYFEACDMCFQLSYSENNPPNKPSDPNPINEAENVSLDPTISVYVTDPDGDNMTVIFYQDSADTGITPEDEEIGRINDVPSGTRADMVWEGLDYNSTYNWYAIANDSEYENRSDMKTDQTPGVSQQNL